MSKLIMTVVYNARPVGFGKRKVVTEHSSGTDSYELKKSVYENNSDVVSVTTRLWKRV